MVSPPGNFRCSFLKYSLFLLLAVLYSGGAPARAESLLLLRYGMNDQRPVNTTPVHVKHQTVVGLNDNGDLVIRRDAISMTLAYSPPDEPLKSQEYMKLAQRQDLPSISGISIRMAVMF